MIVECSLSGSGGVVLKQRVGRCVKEGLLTSGQL